MSDYKQLKKLLKKINVPFEIYDDKANDGYRSITVLADASDKYVTITFEDGKFSYSN